MILRCPCCRKIKEWERSPNSPGPGQCPCKAWAPWHVLKEMPDITKGHVIVMGSKGWQQLRGPNWGADPNAWKNYPVK